MKLFFTNGVILLFCMALMSVNTLLALLNLEQNAQSFVLATKKICIPGYLDAFNPSAIRWNGRILMCFRTYHPDTRATDQVGFVYLNEEFEPVGAPRLIQFVSEPNSYSKGRQDPKLICIGEDLHLVYNEIVEGNIRRMRAGRLHFNEAGDAIVRPMSHPMRFDGEIKARNEKNWVPFDYEGALYLAYSLVPHIIFQPHLESGVCETVVSTTSLLKWDWGVLRGGTPALIENGEYFAFFHSSKSMATEHSQGQSIPHYFIGAYTFSTNPPFQITRISPKPIVGHNFYEGQAHQTWKPLRVVFPGGYLSDATRVWLFYGRQDHEIWVATLDKQALLESLIPLNDTELNVKKE